jgi:hypothetical protein
MLFLLIIGAAGDLATARRQQMIPNHQASDYEARIKDRAYLIWEREGRQDTTPSELWQRAERMIAAKERATRAQASPERG